MNPVMKERLEAIKSLCDWCERNKKIVVTRDGLYIDHPVTDDEVHNQLRCDSEMLWRRHFENLVSA